METQNYKNHRRFIPLFHYALLLIVFAINIISLFNLYFAVKVASGRMQAGACINRVSIDNVLFLFQRIPIKSTGQSNTC